MASSLSKAEAQSIFSLLSPSQKREEVAAEQNRMAGQMTILVPARLLGQELKLRVPYGQDTISKAVIDIVLAVTSNVLRFSSVVPLIRKKHAFGILLPTDNGDGKELMESNAKLSDYGWSCSGEFDFKPWTVFVDLSSGLWASSNDKAPERIKEITITDPDTSLSFIIKQIILELFPEEISEYELDQAITELSDKTLPDRQRSFLPSLTHQSRLSCAYAAVIKYFTRFGLYWKERQTWLAPTDRIVDYPDLRGPKNVLIFVEKKLPFSIEFQKKTFKYEPYNFRMKMSDLVRDLSIIINIAKEDIAAHGLFAFPIITPQDLAENAGKTPQQEEFENPGIYLLHDDLPLTTLYERFRDVEAYEILVGVKPQNLRVMLVCEAQPEEKKKDEGEAEATANAESEESDNEFDEIGNPNESDGHPSSGIKHAQQLQERLALSCNCNVDSDHSVVDALGGKESENEELSPELLPPPPPPPPSSLELTLYFSATIKETGNVITKKFGLEGLEMEYVLCTEDVETGQFVPLKSTFTLLQLNIPEHSTLSLVHKSLVNLSDPFDDNVCIWNFQPTEETVVVENKENGEKTISAGTINVLVNYLTNDKRFDLNFTEAFFLTYKSFTTTEFLIRKLKERFDVPDRIDPDLKEKIQIRTLLVIKRWVELLKDQGETEMLESIVASFLTSLTLPSLKTIGQKITHILNEGATRIPSYVHSKAAPNSILPAGPISFDSIDPKELARQLTFMHFELFSAIKSTEFFGLAWSKPKLRHLSPHLMAMIKFFNRISEFVANMICRTKSLSARAKVFSKFIKVGLELRELNNIDLAAALSSGFSNTAVMRLKWTKLRVPQKKLQKLAEMDQLLSSIGSYKNYRTLMKGLVPPAIPFMAISLSDLTFIEDGNPDLIEGLINFRKRFFVYEVLKKISTFQHMPFNIKPVKEIQDWYLAYELIPDEQVYEESLMREPRGVDPSTLE